MPGAPVLHFSGRFRYESPTYNNTPLAPKAPFDPSQRRDKVITTCGCNPSRYFSFRFEDVLVTRITYRDGSTAQGDDSMLGQPVKLDGYLVDVSPSSVNARLFAGQWSVGEVLEGRLDLADQSTVRLSIRKLGSVDTSSAAHYETRCALGGVEPLSASRYCSEIGSPTELEIYFHVNRWSGLDTTTEPASERLRGDVYGYLRPRPTFADKTGLRLVSRRVVAHPRLDKTALREFIESPNTDPGILVPGLEIDGTYDLFPEDRLVALRYLDFVPFLDRCRSTPEVDGYLVSLQSDHGYVRFDLGLFRGDISEMRQCGGLLHFEWPDGADAEGLRLVVEAVKPGGRLLPLMRESEWDLRLMSPRGVLLPSAGSADARVQVFRRNRPAADQTVRWQEGRTTKSPKVVSPAPTTAKTDAAGIATVRLQAHDFQSGTPVLDPVTNTQLTDFPLDRYYGNPILCEIDNPDRYLSGGIEQAKIAVRVLHEFPSHKTPTIPSFARDIKPLFAYHTRYYPWLHVQDDGTAFNQFLDIDDYDDFRNNVDGIIDRLELGEDDPHKMPVSRDFPFGGADLIRKWKNTGMSR